MSYLEPFVPSGYGFEERIGEPDAFDAAVGRVAMGFSYIEDSLSDAIERMLKVGPAEGSALTAEMAFRNKVHLFASLVRLQRSRENFNLGTEYDPEVYLRELIAACFLVE